MMMSQNSNQLSLFGLSVDQNTFQSIKWGKLDFFKAGSDKWTDTCRHCLLWKNKEDQTDDDECLSAPCSPGDRIDGLCGYYSIHEMPQKNNSN